MFDLLPWMWHHNSLTDWKCAVHKSCLTHVCRSKSYHSKGATDHVLVCVSFCLPLKIHRQKVTILVVFVIRSLNTFHSVLYLAWIHPMSINWVDGDRLQIPIGLIRWFGHVVQLYWNIKRERSPYMAIPQIGSTFLSWLLLCEYVCTRSSNGASTLWTWFNRVIGGQLAQWNLLLLNLNYKLHNYCFLTICLSRSKTEKYIKETNNESHTLQTN